MELHELFPAIQAAEKAVSLNPHWHIAYQTLGRAQMGYGDVEMVSFKHFIFLTVSHSEIMVKQTNKNKKTSSEKKWRDEGIQPTITIYKCLFPSVHFIVLYSTLTRNVF